MYLSPSPYKIFFDDFKDSAQTNNALKFIIN